MQPVIDYAIERAPRRWVDWLRLGPFFAVVCAALACLKSAQYHRQGQLREEQLVSLSLIVLSMPCLIVTVARFSRYRSDGRRKLIRMIVLCALVLALDALAVWNLSTATVGVVKVLDPAGNPVVGAKVTAVSLSITGGSNVTDAKGKALLPTNAPGAKWVVVSKLGFEPAEVDVPKQWPLWVTLKPATQP